MADQIPLAYLDFMEAACAAGPYLLVLEDIQWGDAASLKLISYREDFAPTSDPVR
jgi:eukaryotic-like serine/threonine-protein kinase